MVNFRKLGDRAKDLVERRGGTDSLKQDAAELKEIATGKGSLSDKAKAAAAAIKDPGAKAEEAAPEPEPTEPAAAAERRAGRKERRAERRKERAERREGGPDVA